MPANSTIKVKEGIKVINSNVFLDKVNLLNIILPDSIIKIKSSAFQNCTSLNNIIIPNTVTTIESYAFQDCTSLSEVIISDNVTKIGEKAFYNTPWYDSKNGIIYIGSVLYGYNGQMPANTSINIKNGITSINPNAFNNCYNLVSVSIPETVNYIGDYAFYNCKQIKQINILNDIEYIGKNAFSNCDNLEKVIIGQKDIEFENICEINERAFSNCDKLTNFVSYKPINLSVAVFSSNSNLKVVSLLGGINKLEENAFNNCIKLYQIEIANISENLREDAVISELAFSDCISLKEITLPDNIVKICTGAFNNCKNLETVKFAGETPVFEYRPFIGTKVDMGTSFIGNEGVVSVIIPEGEQTIEDWTFFGAKNLKTIYLPSTLTTISQTALFGCNNLENIIISSDNPNFTVEDGILYNKDKTTLIRCLPGKDNTVTIPSTVTSINKLAFNGCSKLKGDLVIPGNVEIISREAFYGCTSEINLILKEGVKEIHEYAFCNSKFTGDLIIPDSVTVLRDKVFKNCYNFNGILKIGNNISYINRETFANCYNLTGDIVLPENLNRIYDQAFYNCTGFDGDLIIKKLDGIYIQTQAFSYCTGIKRIKGNIIFVSRGGFFNCSLLENTGNLQEADVYSFAYCTNLKEVNAQNWYGSAFDRDVSIESLRIGTAITDLYRCFISKCTNLKTLYIPSSVTSVNEKAIYKCDNLEDIYVDKNKSEVDYDSILRSFCENIHYLDSVYTINKTVEENIEIQDIESSEGEGYKFGSTYKFKVTAKEGYTLNNVIVKVKERNIERILEPHKIDGELVYVIENIENDLEILVDGEVIITEVPDNDS